MRLCPIALCKGQRSRHIGQYRKRTRHARQRLFSRRLRVEHIAQTQTNTHRAPLQIQHIGGIIHGDIAHPFFGILTDTKDTR